MMHHLDPRNVGVTEPDVEINELPNGRWEAFFSDVHTFGYATEAVALRTVRIAAGYGHVAEQPCERFVHEPDTGRCEHDGDCGDCFECAWTEERHGKGER